MKLLRLGLVLLIALGVVLPRGSAVLAGAIGMGPGLIVVCTPSGLITIRLGADGTPVETQGDPQHCTLVHAGDTAVATAPLEPMAEGYATLAPWYAITHSPGTPRHAPNRPRAPPVLVA